MANVAKLGGQEDAVNFDISCIFHLSAADFLEQYFLETQNNYLDRT